MNGDLTTITGIQTRPALYIVTNIFYFPIVEKKIYLPIYILKNQIFMYN